MRGTGLVTSLHFRITAAFVLLVVLGGAAYYLWIEQSLYEVYDDEAERTWYEELAADELDSLATSLAPLAGEPQRIRDALRAYWRDVAGFDVELLVFDPAGRRVATSDPDSLDAAVPAADAGLLRDMSDGDWDFGTYPVSGNIDAWENRIFDVRRLVPPGGDAASPAGFLVASFTPVTIAVDEIEAGERKLGVYAVLLLLLYAAASSTIIMLWTTRRLRRLSGGVAAFAGGDLSARVPAASSDEIGALGRHINTMAERIETMVGELTQKERFQRQLVANVSHDLRTPLASLRGYVETLLLAGGQVRDAERRRYLAVITEKLDHLDTLIEHLLVLSRIESGQATLRREDISLGELAGEVLEHCAAPAAERGVGLELDLEPGLPDVHADALQMGRVLQNLVENGVKFTPRGGAVAVRARRAGDAVRVEVADTGEGIAPGDLPHIFERFYTGDESRTVVRPAGTDRDRLGRGSGLGLAIASRIVEAHGGRLEVCSAVGEGSVFGFTLAAGPGAADAPEAAGA